MSSWLPPGTTDADIDRACPGYYDESEREEEQQAMYYNGPTDLIDAALAAAQAEMTDAIYNQVNPHFKSKYADLSAVRRATLRHLAAHGIRLSQTSRFDEHGNYVLITELGHKGQKIQDVQARLRAPDKPQVEQSDLTYKRRAGWSSICGVAVAGEDDDGNAATTRTVNVGQLDELMQISIDRKVDMAAFLAFATARLGYNIENLSMVKQDDVGRVTSWLKSKKEAPA